MLRNKRTGPFRYWREIDLSETMRWGTNPGERIITLRHYSKSRMKGIDLHLRFGDGDDYANWLYRLLVSLIEHSPAAIEDEQIKSLRLAGEQGKGKRRRGKLRARRDMGKFDSAHNTFTSTQATGFENLPRARGSNHVVTGDRGGRVKIQGKAGSGGQAEVRFGNLDVKSLVNAALGLDPDSAPYWHPAAKPVIIKTARTEKGILLVREARIHAAMGEHKNIIRLIDVAAGSDGVYVILEKGQENLEEHVARVRLNTRRRLEIALGIIHGVNHMHNCGIYHRDIKPPNVVMTADGTPKLIDFGAASAPLFSSRGALVEPVVATGPYNCPEINEPLPRKKREIAGRFEKRDSFALGLTILECLVGPNNIFNFGNYRKGGGTDYKVQYWSGEIGSLRHSRLKEFAEIALKMCDLNMASRLTVKEAKRQCKTKLRALSAVVEANRRELEEARRRSQRIQQRVNAEFGTAPVRRRR
jgi:serine/threonine protein kinase